MTGPPIDGGARPSAADASERIFLAVPITERIRTLLRDRLSQTQLPGRPVPPQNWHLTLRFLGETPASAVISLAGALSKAPLGGPFNLTFGKSGAFPRPARASVLWVGVAEGAEALGDLAARVERTVQAEGFPRADHPFRAHLTLSRLSPPANVRTFLERDLQLDEEMPVEEVVIFRSRLGQGPARYEAVERIPLTG